MQLLLLIAICAGVTYGQSSSQEYSDCENKMPIVTECSEKYLKDYLMALDQSSYAHMTALSKLDDILALIQETKLDAVCNNTEKLKMYYTCVFTNLTNCLVNKTQAEMVPTPASIAKGIVGVCSSRANLNKTCVKDNMDAALTCVSEGSKQSSTCEIYKAEYMCMDKFSDCKGVQDMRDFIQSARPNICSEISAATQILTTISLLLLATLSSMLMNL